LKRNQKRRQTISKANSPRAFQGGGRQTKHGAKEEEGCTTGGPNSRPRKTPLNNQNPRKKPGEDFGIKGETEGEKHKEEVMCQHQMRQRKTRAVKEGDKVLVEQHAPSRGGNGDRTGRTAGGGDRMTLQGGLNPQRKKGEKRTRTQWEKNAFGARRKSKTNLVGKRLSRLAPLQLSEGWRGERVKRGRKRKTAQLTKKKRPDQAVAQRHVPKKKRGPLGFSWWRKSVS